MTTAYTNDLESLYSQLPGWLQGPLRPVYNEMDGWLHAVAGNPQELLQAGDGYASLAQQITQLAAQQQSDRARLSGQWEGQAYEAFTATMARVEAQLSSLANATGNTKEVLAAGAQACTEGANTICQIVASLLTFLITSLVVNGILAIFTFGASLAAEIAEAIADALESLSMIMRVVDEVSQVLLKIASLLRKLAETLKMVTQALKELQQIYNDTKVLKMLKAKNWVGAGTHIGIGAGARTTFNTIAGSNIPGGGGELFKAGKTYVGGVNDANAAAQDAQRP